MFNFILTLLLISSTAFGTVANRIPDLLVNPKTTGARPSGETGQIYDNSTLAGYQFYFGSWQTAATNSNILTFTNKSIDCLTNTCTNIPATTINIINDTTTNATMYPAWVTTTSGVLAPYVSSTKMTFNPSSGMLTTTGVTSAFTGNITGNVTGNLTGNVTGTSSIATNTTITDDTTTNATMYPTWVTTTTGNLPQKISSTKMTFNPSTGMLTTTGVTAAVTGNSSTATALAADPADCAADTYATTINASGTLTCATVTNAGLAGSIAASKLLGSDIATVGTITSGTWSATAIAATKGGTGLTTYTLGDTLYSSAANTLAKLAGNTTTETRVYTQTGDGVNSAAPNWTYPASSLAVASSFVVRDASQNFTSGKISAVFAPNTTVIATAAGTTTLTSTSSQQEIFTGSTTQTVVLPVVTTLQNGYYYRIINLSTGQVTVQTSGTNSLQVMGANTELIATVLDSTAGTGTASWTTRYTGLASSGGGGGGSLIWIEDADGQAPLRDTSSNFAVRLFEAGRTQYMYTAIRVPTSYVAGNQINLKIPYSSPDTTGTVQLTCLATLIRTGTDAVTSTTNQRTSTNGTDNLATGALANKMKTQTCDITSSIGQINAVGDSGGDVVLVRLTRGTDTATSNIKVYVELSEVTFQ